MSVVRYNLENCIGCRRCMELCPMDVFRFNEMLRKSVIAYPESCQSCGQCFFYCPGHSLAISNETYGHTINAFRTAPKDGMDRTLLMPEP